jgi:hypothetical protein
MARIRLLQNLQTEKTIIPAGREVLCNWSDAVRMERYGLAVIILPPYEERESQRSPPPTTSGAEYHTAI